MDAATIMTRIKYKNAKSLKCYDEEWHAGWKMAQDGHVRDKRRIVGLAGTIKPKHGHDTLAHRVGFADGYIYKAKALGTMFKVLELTIHDLRTLGVDPEDYTNDNYRKK